MGVKRPPGPVRATRKATCAHPLPPGRPRVAQLPDQDPLTLVIIGMSPSRGEAIEVSPGQRALAWSEGSRLVRGLSPGQRANGGGDGNRTRVQGFAGPCLSHSATPPQGPCRKGIRSFESGRRDSNPRPSPWQGDALPTEPRPHRTSGCDQNCSRSCRSRKLGSPLFVTPVTRRTPRTGTHRTRGPRPPIQPDQPLRAPARSSGAACAVILRYWSKDGWVSVEI